MFLRICYSVTAQKGLSDSEYRELVAVFSACVKLYFLFLVVNSMKICLQCGGESIIIQKWQGTLVKSTFSPCLFIIPQMYGKKIMEK